MKKILERIKANKEMMKAINGLGHYSPEMFLHDAKAYIKAIKSGRMLCIIESVSTSGMSRVIKFNSCEFHKERCNYRQYWSLFKTLGYREAKNSRDGFRINGCGMDMVFNTNYNIMHDFKNLGIITKEECAHLAQQTPVKL